jgi:hypothetical protein
MYITVIEVCTDAKSCIPDQCSLMSKCSGSVSWLIDLQLELAVLKIIAEIIRRKVCEWNL